MDGCVPVLLALWAYATLSDEAVSLTEGEAEAKKKADSVEALASIKCLSRRAPVALEEEQANDSRQGVKSRDKAGRPAGVEEESHTNTNNVVVGEAWRDCELHTNETCPQPAMESCQLLPPCATASPTSIPAQLKSAVGAVAKERTVPLYTVVAREGDELQLSCGSSGADTWFLTVGGSATRLASTRLPRRGSTSPPSAPELQAALLQGRLLRFGRVRRQHARRYTCRFKSARDGHLVVADAHLVVQYAPSVEPLEVLRGEQDSRLVCVAGALPSPEIAWLRDDQPLGEEDAEAGLRSATTSEGCRRISKLHLKEETKGDADAAHNYTCVARNPLGTASRSLLLRTGAGWANGSLVRDQDPLDGVPMKRFKITGFVIGMLPPLFISFYIILKLGYRSRYAEERPEETGMMEEPFFISN
ncbi:uncharacterized protein LOC144178825 [Haemaphysalis longicornis]